jgi:deazaflavin-dependent oxidoreductase (nitroreductase family)
MNKNPQPSDVHYQRPGFFTRYLFNAPIRLLTKVGIGAWGARTLEVTGRKSGLPRQTPVNLLTIEDHHYLVAPRGEAEWVRNLRADDGRLVLIIGRHRQEWKATELTDSDKTEVLRSYLRRWKFEVGVFFGGVDAKSSDEELSAIAPRHPVFELVEA